MYQESILDLLKYPSKRSRAQTNLLYASTYISPIGEMLIVANHQNLVFLEFLSLAKIMSLIEKLKIQSKSRIVEGKTSITDLAMLELDEYFSGNLREFKTPIQLHGTIFQTSIWQQLLDIPYGETRSYLDIPKKIGIPKSYRAAANANGANKIAIIVPCHRVVGVGDIGGYAAGIEKKQALLDLEQRASGF